MAPADKQKGQEQERAEPTMVGWQGLRFVLPPDWNITGFSMDRDNGYLKVDSPGSMFVQVKWTQPGADKARTLGDLVMRGYRRLRPSAARKTPPPDLRTMVDAFLKQTAKAARKAKSPFTSKVRPETTEADGERTAVHFTWTGGGQGQGKIWHCTTCGRVVIAQVVGQQRDNLGDTAAHLFSSFVDHAQEGWNTWALYDLVAGVPESFSLKSQKLMSGFLRLDFERRGGERLRIERWGLANVTRRKFTLAEWLTTTGEAGANRLKPEETEAQGHAAVRAAGRIRGPLAVGRALMDSLPVLRPPALQYDGVCWECGEENKLYAIQAWHSRRTTDLLPEVVARCECH